MATIEARILRVFQDERDWFNVVTDHPSIGTDTNPLRTKKVEKAREAKAWAESGETLVIEAKHQQRPREGGGVWDNYYYESAMTTQRNGGEGRAAETAIERVERPPSTGGRSDDEAWRIALSVGVKMVGEELPTGAIKDASFGALRERALAWATFVFTTPKPDPNSQPSSRGAYADEPVFAEDEDEIPF